MPTGQQLTLKQTADQATQELLSATGSVYDVEDHLSNELRISVGKFPPAEGRDVAVGLNLSSPTNTPSPSAGKPIVLAQIVQESATGLLDQFEAIPATVTSDSRTIQAQVPGYAFTNQRDGSDGDYEAVIALGWTTPHAETQGLAVAVPRTASRVPQVARSTTTQAMDGTSFPCPSLGSPIKGWNVATLNQHVSSPFGRRGAKNGPHYGVDFAVPVGTPVLSPISGRVAAINWQYNASQSGTVTKGSGWGQYVVIQGGDGSTLLLAHLEGGPNGMAPAGQTSPSQLGLAVGQSVSAGDLIGYSDTTGGATGPHLHMELVAPGQGGRFGKAANRFKVNPVPCFTVKSSPSPITPPGAFPKSIALTGTVREVHTNVDPPLIVSWHISMLLVVEPSNCDRPTIDGCGYVLEGIPRADVDDSYEGSCSMPPWDPDDDVRGLFIYADWDLVVSFQGGCSSVPLVRGIDFAATTQLSPGQTSAVIPMDHSYSDYQETGSIVLTLSY